MWQEHLRLNLVNPYFSTILFYTIKIVLRIKNVQYTVPSELSDTEVGLYFNEVAFSFSLLSCFLNYTCLQILSKH